MKYLEKQLDPLLSYPSGVACFRGHDKSESARVECTGREVPSGTRMAHTLGSPMPLTDDSPLASSEDQRIDTDYSEEAIPERDPAYRLSDGTLHETQTTVEYLPAAERLALSRCLEELGISPARAAFVASL